MERYVKKLLIVLLIVVVVLSVFFVYLYVIRSERAPLWKQDTVHGFDNFGTATYQDGVLYAPSKGDNRVYALNASNGQIIWSSNVRQCDASPCIDGNVVYVGECSGPEGEQISNPKAMALNKMTGTEIWQFTEPDDSEWVGSPLVNSDYVYYTTFGSGVYALNKTNGNPIWHRKDIGTVVCSVACHDGVVFVSAHNSTGQHALNATTGDNIWHVDYGASWDSSPIVYKGMVIQVARNADKTTWSTYVLNETDGELIRKFEETGSPSTPLVHGNRIFIPSDDTRVWAFSLTTGEELWHTKDLREGVSTTYLRNPLLSYCSPVSTGETIYFQSLSGTFYAIDEEDGNISWSAGLGGYGFGSPSIGEGCIFITNDSALYAFTISEAHGDWPMFCQNKLHQSYKE